MGEGCRMTELLQLLHSNSAAAAGRSGGGGAEALGQEGGGEDFKGVLSQSQIPHRFFGRGTVTCLA